MSNAVISFPMLGDWFRFSAPNYFTLFGHRFYWYGLIIAVGFLLAVYYCCRRGPQFGITSDNIIDMLICAVPSGVIGARLYYVVFNYSLYRDNFVDVFKIWEGGLAIYGGIIFSVAAAIIFCRVKKIPAGAMLDVAGLGLLIGQAIGRWGNFMNREAFGAETDVFCRMGLTTESGTIYVHPTFLYESLWNLLGLILLHIYSKKGKRKYDGQLFIMYIGWYGLGRMFIEGLRTDSLYLFGTGVRVSQALAAASVIIVLGILFFQRVFREHYPEELWVNRKAALAAEAAANDEASVPGEETGAEEEEETDAGPEPEEETEESESPPAAEDEAEETE